MESILRKRATVVVIGASQDYQDDDNDGGSSSCSSEMELIFDDMGMNPSAGFKGMSREQALSSKAGEEKKPEDDGVVSKPCRFWQCFCHLKGTFPRFHALIFRVVVPLFILIFIAYICGYFLAHMEAPSEFDENDFLLSRRIIQTGAFRDGLENSFNLPLRCFDKFLESKGYPNSGDDSINQHFYGSGTVDSIADGQDDPDSRNETNSLNPNTTTGLEYYTDGNTSDNGSVHDASMERVNTFVNETRDYMEKCGQEAGELLALGFDAALAVNEVQNDNQLTFTWIRCWDESLHGSMLWTVAPSTDQLVAVQNQSVYYEDLWTEMQQELYENYLEEYPDTPIGRLTAFNRSITEATGRHGCEENLGGTAWFWFTVMSTVGYGNQTPHSAGGRRLVVFMGTFCIILFGVLLAVAGHVTKALFEDIWYFCRLRALNRPLVVALTWAIAAAGWMFVLGGRAQNWWHNRAPEGESSVTIQDSWWFAYISTTTIGLGDLYLQPEYMFMGDVLAFSGMFLFGFVLLSSFLSALAQVLVGIVRVDTFGEEFRRKARLMRMISYKFLDSNDEDDDSVSNEDIATLSVLLSRQKQNTSNLTGPRSNRLRELMKQESLARQLLRRTRAQALELFDVDNDDASDLFRDDDIDQLRREEDLFAKMSKRITLERMEAENDDQKIYTTCSQTTVHA